VLLNFGKRGCAAGDARRYAASMILNMRITTIILLLALLILSVGCNSKAPAECRQLCSLPEEQQHQVFKSFPVEKQFDLYIGCENEKSCWRDSESTHDYYGQWMAEDGKAASFLAERLKGERDERVQHDIIYVLRFMAVNGHLKGERRIADVVNQAVARMDGGDEWGVKQSQKWAKEIEGNTQ
jgi:hypothetical protein